MRKNKSASADRPRRFRISKAALIKIFLTALVLSAVYTAFRRFTDTPFFLVREVIVRQDGSLRSDSGQFNYLCGKNIFALSLSAESRRMSRSYPSYQQVRVSKFYPDKVFVDFIKRKPFACVHAAKTWYLDQDLVVFELPAQAAAPCVPVLTGIEKAISSADAGSRLENARASQSLVIIRHVKDAKALAGYMLTRVDVTVPNSFMLFFAVPEKTLRPPDEPPAPEASLKVKIGQEDIRQKLAVLETLLAQVSNRLYTIEYIDLRFKEPVIKFKERK